MRFNFISLVYFEHKKDEYVLLHGHDTYELVFYIDGEGYSYVEAEKMSFSKNSLCIIKPNERHDEVYQSDASVFIVQFTCEKKLNNIFLNLSDKSAEYIKDLLLQIKEEDEKKESYYQSVCNLLLKRLFSEINRSLNVKEQSIKEQTVASIKEHIKQNFNKNIELKDLATKYNYSCDRLRHIFFEAEQITINQYLLNVRFSESKKMLEDSELQIKEVAIACGFSSVAHFVNFFTKRMGISPREYRDMNNEKLGSNIGLLTQAPTVIVDTDLGSDCDDAGAFALLNIYKNNNEVNVACITHDTSQSEGAACVDIICKYFGNNFPIGKYRGEYFVGNIHSDFASHVVKKFGNGMDIDDYPEAVSLLRKSLYEAKSKVTLVSIGHLNNFTALLKSEPDDICPLSGMELFEDKVKEVAIMGGIFNNGGEPVRKGKKVYEFEYNFYTDMESTRYFISECPSKLTFIDTYMGQGVKTLGHIIQDENDPVAVSYKDFCNGKRESWDLVTVMYAVKGLDKMFYRSKMGVVTFDEAGHSIFTEKKNGNHSYLSYKVSEKEMTKIINDLYDYGKKQLFDK